MIRNGVDIPLSAAPDSVRRGCPDCARLAGAVTWWCNSDAARARRGTTLPGARGCADWQPAPYQSCRPSSLMASLRRWGVRLFGPRWVTCRDERPAH